MDRNFRELIKFEGEVNNFLGSLDLESNSESLVQSAIDLEREAAMFRENERDYDDNAFEEKIAELKGKLRELMK